MGTPTEPTCLCDHPQTAHIVACYEVDASTDERCTCRQFQQDHDAWPGFVMDTPTGRCIPDLIFDTPSCSDCGRRSTATDGDAWWCEHCGATWAKNGTDGKAGS